MCELKDFAAELLRLKNKQNAETKLYNNSAITCHAEKRRLVPALPYHPSFSTTQHITTHAHHRTYVTNFQQPAIPTKTPLSHGRKTTQTQTKTTSIKLSLPHRSFVRSAGERSRMLLLVGRSCVRAGWRMPAGRGCEARGRLSSLPLPSCSLLWCFMGFPSHVVYISASAPRRLSWHGAGAVFLMIMVSDHRSMY